MRTFSRRAAVPADGWFQIGELSEQTPPRHRGQGRVSLSANQHDPDTASPPAPAPRRDPVLVRADAAAARVLGRIIERRYGALALCVAALLLVLIVAVSASSPTHAAARPRHTSSSAAGIHHPNGKERGSGHSRA